MRGVALLIFLPILACAQIRVSKLEVIPGQTFTIQEGDILVVDTLIMRDSSAIRLNRKLTDNFIHAKVLIVGNGARILGHGAKGQRGIDGRRGTTPSGPCADGVQGRGGTGGSHGENGNNLSIYTTDFQLQGSLIVDLAGGDGGDGGDGGPGGGGGQGTRVCVGGNGGNGGNGGTGGNGGSGGTFNINCKTCPNLRLWLGERMVVRNFGGFAGIGGEPGRGGSAGLGVNGDSAKDGKNGGRGKKGADGEPGKPGSVNFDHF